MLTIVRTLLLLTMLLLAGCKHQHRTQCEWPAARERPG